MKKLKLLILLFICCKSISFAQINSATNYGNLITGADLRKHLTIIASDEMDGRETGTEGQRKAAAYIEGQFLAIGLKTADTMKGYQQYYPLFQDSISSELLINKKLAIYGEDYISPAMFNENGTSQASQLIFAGYGIDDKNYSDYTNLNVKNKIVVIFAGEPKKDGSYFISGSKRSSKWTYPGLSEKLAIARAKGATGALVINPLLVSFTPQATGSSKKTNFYFPHEGVGKPVNFAVLSHVFAKNMLGNSFDSLLKQAKEGLAFEPSTIKEWNTTVAFDYKKFRNTVYASNVIGIIEGTDKKDEYLFLTGHYDHLGNHNGKIYYGADDDGSGTCAVIEMAQAFAKAKADGHGPRRTIVFMTVSGEEKGLWGSEYYSDHPIYPLAKTSADLNTDMVGRVDTERKLGDTLNYVYVIGHNKLSSDLPVINETANNNNTHLTLDYRYDDPADQERIYYRSDHYNFARKGVPILFFYDGMLKADYHKPTDTVDKINFELYEKRVRMIFYTAWEIANRADMLKRDIPLTGAGE